MKILIPFRKAVRFADVCLLYRLHCTHVDVQLPCTREAEHVAVRLLECVKLQVAFSLLYEGPVSEKWDPNGSRGQATVLVGVAGHCNEHSCDGHSYRNWGHTDGKVAEYPGQRHPAIKICESSYYSTSS